MNTSANPPFRRRQLWLRCMYAWLPVRRQWDSERGLFEVYAGGHLVAVEYFGG